MMGASAQLAFLVVLLASAPFLAPYAVEARHKKRHQHGQHVSPPPAEPSSPPAPAPLPPFETPSLPPQSVELSPATSPVPPTEAPATSDIRVPTGSISPSLGYQAPPYQIHGCGFPYSDSNDCDWPCTVCYGNHTYCYDDPMF